MQKNKWSRKFDWIKSGNTYYQQTRSDIYDENKIISVGDIYFRFNKYLTGVTYSYINSLENIYKKDLLTGDGYSITNMYNEYDIIDAFMKNIIDVDISSNVNIDITCQWKVIDDVKLKPGHLVLLKYQDSEFENDVYRVDNNYFLQNSGFLSSRESSFRFSCSVKMGSNSDKQFFLVNNGDEFPITAEPKYFIEGRSLILKNLINYNVSNIDRFIIPKMIFTDYDFARKQLSLNSELYDNININVNQYQLPDEFIKINYYYDSYIIRSGVTTEYYGSTSLILNSTYTQIPFPNLFEYAVGDQVNITLFSGSSTILNFYTYIKKTGITNSTNYLILNEILPNNILNDLKYTTFRLTNLQVAFNWYDAIDKLHQTTYSDFFQVYSGLTDVGTMNITFKPKVCEYNKYFDYDSLIFSFEGYNSLYNYNSLKFETLNLYIKYNLFEILNNINNELFTTGFTFYNKFNLNTFSYNYTDYSRIRITTTVSGLTNIFKPYTYVYMSGDTMTVKSLIYNVNEYELIVEKPPVWNSNINLISIQNIDGLKDISDILYNVYINETYDWYVQKTDNERKYIAKSYAELLTLNNDIRDNVTGILYENENNEFLLKLYDLGYNISVNESSDTNLFFSTIDVIYIGSDRKSRLPVSTVANSGITLSKYPMRVSSGETSNDLNYSILDGGLDDSLNDIDSHILGDYMSSGLDDVLPGPTEYSPLFYTIIDGGLDII